MTWVAIGLVLAVVSGAASVPFVLLFRPWRMRRLAFWLARVWPWYRFRVGRLLMRRFTRAMEEANRVIGETFLPGLQECTRQMAALTWALRGEDGP